MHVAQQVVLAVTQSGRFLKFNKNLNGWIEVPEAISKQKVCQALQYWQRRGKLQGDVPSGAHAELRGAPSQNATALGAAYAHQPSEPQPPAAESITETTQIEIAESDTDFIELLRTLSQGLGERDR
jgi:hypothetical protein